MEWRVTLWQLAIQHLIHAQKINRAVKQIYSLQTLNLDLDHFFKGHHCIHNLVITLVLSSNLNAV